jgi:hypothetical protein
MVNFWVSLFEHSFLFGLYALQVQDSYPKTATIFVQSGFNWVIDKKSSSILI